MDKMRYIFFCKTNYLLTKKNIIMEKIFNFFKSNAFTGICTVFAAVLMVYTACYYGAKSLEKQVHTVKGGVCLTVDIKGSAKISFFNFINYKEDYAASVQTAINAHSFDVVLSNPAAITAYADSVFYQKTGIKTSALIEITLPEDVEKAMKVNKIAELEFQTLRYQIARDSLISIAAKNDAHGYTAEAERLEKRRDQRFNTAEERKIKKATLESNERIEIRKAKALEEAASNAENLDITLTMK